MKKRVNSVMSSVKFGISQAEITPPIGISANPWGKSASALSTGVHRPLFATTSCFSSYLDRFLVTLDLGWIGCYECDVIKFRNRVVRELGIKIDDLLVNLSQTHKSPPFCIHEAVREGKELVPDYIEYVIQTVIKFEKRILEWDGSANEIPTLDNKYIFIDAFARWRISDALQFYKSAKNEMLAQ